MLIVDDQPDLLRLFATWLRGTAEGSVAIDAKSALVMLEQQSYHAVVTDYDMPGHTGLWLLERVRERDASIRRVLISGTDASAFGGAIASGLVELFVQKPLNRETFLQALRAGQSGLTPKVPEGAAQQAANATETSEDRVTRELQKAAALGAHVMVVLGGDAASGKQVRVCEGTPTGFRPTHDGRARVVLTMSEGIEQLILVERIVRVARV